MMGRKGFISLFIGVCLIAIGLTASASVTDPNIISGAVAVNGTAPEPLVVVKGGLWEGALPFVDRPAVFGDANDLGGLDYVQTAVDDKADADVEYQITLDKAGTLFLIIDNRVGDDNLNDPPTLGSGVMDWVGTMGFTQTAYTVNISTPATVYALPVAGAGTINLGAQANGSTRVMYVVAAAPAGWNLRPTIIGIPSIAQVLPGDSLAIDGTVADDGIPGTGVTVQWTTLTAPDGAVVAYSDETSEDVTITFTANGNYTLQISADDGEKSTQMTVKVAVQIPTFAVECTNWVEAVNDTKNGGPTAHYKPTSYMYVRNHSAPRRRIQLISYDISALKEEGKVLANTFLTLRRRTGSLNEVLSVYGVNEELDNFDLDTGSWSTLPGVQNTPVPPMTDQITLASLDLADLSELLLEQTDIPVASAWSSTQTSAALDEFLNADTDGTVLLLFVTFSPQDADFEIFAKGYDAANAEPETGMTGIILRGNVMTPTWATNPVPAMNTSQSTSLSQLSWTNPEPSEEGATVTCDVFIGTGEPNALQTDYGFTTLAAGISGNSVSIPSGTLAVNTVYKWIVDVHDSVAGTTRGFVWSFDTNNAMPTVTMEAPYQYLWLGNAGDPATATVVLNATVDDDNFPNPYTLLWEQVSAPEGAEVVIDPNNIEDITLVLPQTGTYIFKLSANDGDLTGSGAAEIFVGATPCDAAKAKPDYTATIGDFDNDCYVDINDFATFAAHWLECHSFMDAPCI